MSPSQIREGARQVRRVVLASALAVGAFLTAGCQPTGVPECDRNVAALVVADVEGYRYDCTPTEVQLPAHKDGWADHENRVLYVRPDGTNFTIKVMWHELGHGVYTNRYGLSGTQAQREDWADGYAWCRQPIPGMSYRVKPTNCALYI